MLEKRKKMSDLRSAAAWERETWWWGPLGARCHPFSSAPGYRVISNSPSEQPRRLHRSGCARARQSSASLPFSCCTYRCQTHHASRDSRLALDTTSPPCTSKTRTERSIVLTYIGPVCLMVCLWVCVCEKLYGVGFGVNASESIK